MYSPIIKYDEDNNTIVYLNRNFPKCSEDEMMQFQGYSEEENRMEPNNLLIESDSEVESTQSCIKTKIENMMMLEVTPEIKLRDRSLGT